MGPGGLPGLQNRVGGRKAAGGFDSLPPPPMHIDPGDLLKYQHAMSRCSDSPATPIPSVVRDRGQRPRTAPRPVPTWTGPVSSTTNGLSRNTPSLYATPGGDP